MEWSNFYIVLPVTTCGLKEACSAEKLHSSQFIFNYMCRCATCASQKQFLLPDRVVEEESWSFSRINKKTRKMKKRKKKGRLEFMPNRTYSSFFKDSVSTHHVISYAASWAAAILVCWQKSIFKVFKAAFVVVLTKVVKTFNSVAEKSPTNLLELRHWKMFFP